MAWQGNGIFRSGGMDFIPAESSAAARLLAGVYGPHPNQSAPPGFGGVIAGPGGAQTYGSGSHLAQLLAGFNQANPGGMPQTSPGIAPPMQQQAPAAVPQQAQMTPAQARVLQYLAKRQLGNLDPMNANFGALASVAGTGHAGGGGGR